MIGTVIVTAIIALLAGFLGALIALKIQYRYLQRTQAQRTAWEHAQESGQRNWEVKQEKRALETDAKLVTGIQRLESDWNGWKQKNAELAQAVSQQHAEIATFLHIERELARIPLVEEMPIAFDGKGQRLPLSSRWQPLALARVDLSERDLSRRYLGQANLREARLRGANLFMADLSGADLSGADLTGADLTGANLSHADLRNAILLNANLQVADMHNTILFGANLHGTRNLSTQQLDTAIYDATSQLDTDTDLTLPRLPRVNKTILTSTSSAQAPSTHPPLSDIPDTPIVRAKQKASDRARMVEFIETPDLDISPTPARETHAVPPSPILFEADRIIEGEITEITEAITIETAAVPASHLSEAADAEIREISDSETGAADETVTVEAPATSKFDKVEAHEISEANGTGEAAALAASETDSGAASDDTVSTLSGVSLNEGVESQTLLKSLEETEVPDITPPPMPASFELPVAKNEPVISDSESAISASEPSIAENEMLVAENEPPVSESEPLVAESEIPVEVPSRTANTAETEAQAELTSSEPEFIALDVATEAPAELAPTEPEFVALEIEHGNGNGDGNDNSNGNGHKGNTSAGSTSQKGKNTGRKRSRTR